MEINLDHLQLLENMSQEETDFILSLMPDGDENPLIWCNNYVDMNLKELSNLIENSKSGFKNKDYKWYYEAVKEDEDLWDTSLYIELMYRELKEMPTLPRLNARLKQFVLSI